MLKSEKFLERYEFGGIEFLGHDEPPDRVEEKHIKEVGIDQAT
jgi:hypothetical protein